MFKSILLGVDGSGHALKAAHVAGDIARCMQADVWVVVSFDPIPTYLGEELTQEVNAARLQHAQEILKPALEAIGKTETSVKTQILEGPPAEAILSVAEESNIDLIILGTRGLGRLSGLALGSQSQKVLTHANCPVLIAR